MALDTSMLEDIGLTKNEITVFMTLLELGESKAVYIIKWSKLQSSAVYNAISGLVKKGLISYIKKSNVKYYRAADPEVILDYIDNKKNEFIHLLPELKAKQKKQERTGVEFFKSAKGVRTLILEVYKGSKKGDEFMIFSESEEHRDEADKIYQNLQYLKWQRKLKTRGIFQESLRSKNKHITFPMKYLEVIPPNTIMLNDKVAIISWEGEPSGILIKSKDIYKRYVNFFESMWEIAKK